MRSTQSLRFHSEMVKNKVGKDEIRSYKHIISLADYNMDQSRTNFCKKNIIAGVKLNTLSSSSR